MRTFILLALMSVSLWGNEDDSMAVSSGLAEYDGKEISLVGDVVIQHDLGKIQAHRLAILPATSQDKKMKCSALKMDEDVIIDLHGGGQLRCQHAQVDCEQMTGIFEGSQKQIDVVYTDVKHENDVAIPFIMKSSKVSAELAREENDHTVIRHIQADGHVRVFYNSVYTVLADTATFKRTPSEKTSSGILFLTVKNPVTESCWMTSEQGDRIQADHITIDTLKRELTCQSPRGTLVNTPDEKPIQFSSQRLRWDDSHQTLTLENDVQIHQPTLGDIKTPKDVQIAQHIVDGRKVIRTISASEETELTYSDVDRKITHKLICHGPLVVDHEHSQVIFNSPVNANGQTPEDKQVYFEDLMGDIYADHAILSYKMDKELVPQKLVMTGHVKILNRFDGHVQESGSILQYALADEVEYIPATKEMILSGHDQRVLIYDKVNNVQMSAPSFKITRDEKAPKGSIKGMGDVRFTFVDHEIKQFLQRFENQKESP